MSELFFVFFFKQNLDVLKLPRRSFFLALIKNPFLFCHLSNSEQDITVALQVLIDKPMLADVTLSLSSPSIFEDP